MRRLRVPGVVAVAVTVAGARLGDRLARTTRRRSPRSFPTGGDLGPRLGRPHASSATSSATPSRPCRTTAAGRCSAVVGIGVRRAARPTRSRSTPRPRRGARARRRPVRVRRRARHRPAPGRRSRSLLVATGFVAVALLRARFAQPPRTSLGRPRHPLVVTLPAVAVAGDRRRARRLGRSGRACPGADAEPLVDTHNDAAAASPRSSARSSTSARGSSTRRTPSCSSCRPTPPSYWRVDACPSSTATRGACPSAIARRRRRRADRARRPGVDREPPGDHDHRASAASSCPPPPTRRASTASGLRCERRHVDARARPTASSSPATRSTIVSAMPTFTADAAARGRRRATRRTRSTSSCPTTSPASVADMAARGHRRRADPVRRRCSTLQNWFRTKFEYSLEVPARPRQRRPSRRSCASASATASSSPARSRRWRARSASRPGSPSGSRPGSTQADGAYSRARAATPTPGRRCGSTASAGCLRADARAAAQPGAEGYTGVAAAAGRDAPRARRRPDGGAVPTPSQPRPAADDAAADRRSRTGGAAGGRRRPSPRRRPGRRHGSPGTRSLLVVVLVGLHRAARRARAPVARRRHPIRRRRQQIADLWDGRSGAVEADRVPHRPGADPARAGARRVAARCRWRPDPLQVAGRGRHRGDVRAATTVGELDRRGSHGRAGPAPVVPADRADRRRLDDAGGRSAATSPSGAGLTTPSPRCPSAAVVAARDEPASPVQRRRVGRRRGRCEPSAQSDGSWLAAAGAAEPGADRQRAEALAGEQPRPRARAATAMASTTRKPANASQKLTASPRTVSARPPTRPTISEHEAVPGDPVAARRERRVLLELLLDLTEDPLFVLGERHRPIIPRSRRSLNAHRADAGHAGSSAARGL